MEQKIYDAASWVLLALFHAFLAVAGALLVPSLTPLFSVFAGVVTLVNGVFAFHLAMRALDIWTGGD